MLIIRNTVDEKINFYNIGPNDDGATVKFIAEEVVNHFSPGASIIYGTGNKGWIGDVPYFNYSINKLELLGWQPKLNSEQSIIMAIKEIVNHNK